MTLRGWSWEAAIGPAGLGNRPLLEALAAAIPDESVEAAIEATGTRERRRRRLPTHLVVTLVVVHLPRRRLADAHQRQPIAVPPLHRPPRPGRMAGPVLHHPPHRRPTRYATVSAPGRPLDRPTRRLPRPRLRW